MPASGVSIPNTNISITNYLRTKAPSGPRAELKVDPISAVIYMFGKTFFRHYKMIFIACVISDQQSLNQNDPPRHGT